MSTCCPSWTPSATTADHRERRGGPYPPRPGREHAMPDQATGLDPTRTAPLARHRAPRRLPALRCPAWLDRAAEYPRVWWTITAVCTAAAAVLLAIMATGAAGPVTDWNGPRYLKPGIPSPTVAAPATDEPTTHPEPSARPSASPARPKSHAPTPSTTTAPEVPQMPAQRPTPRPRATPPAPEPSSLPPPPHPGPDPAGDPEPDPDPGAGPGAPGGAPGRPDLGPGPGGTN